MSGREFFKNFDEVVTYARGLRLEHLRSEQASQIYISLAETFSFLASVGLFALNIYWCRYGIEDELKRYSKKLDEWRKKSIRSQL